MRRLLLILLLWTPLAASGQISQLGNGSVTITAGTNVTTSGDCGPASPVDCTINASGGGGGSPGGTSGQVQYNNSGSFGGFTVSGDGTINTSTGALTVTKTSGTAFGALATVTPGTGVATALGVNIGTAGAAVVNGGALGTPSSGVATNLTGLPLTTGVTGILPAANGGTGLSTITASQCLQGNGAGTGIVYGACGGSGTVTSVAQTFTGGIISVTGSPVTSSGTLASTVAGTSGGIPYFSSTSAWASSAALAANALMIGGGAGAAPSTTTTGTGVLTALGVNTGSAGAFVVNGGALGTPSSGTLTSATGLPISTGVSGLGTGVATLLGGASSGTGGPAGTTSPTFITPVLGAATGTSLALGGATLGSNALAVTGLANFASAGSAAAPTLSIGNQTTGIYSVSTTGLGISVNGVTVVDYGISHTGNWTFPGFINLSSGMAIPNNVGTYQIGATSDATLSRHAAANWQLGSLDSAAPVAQTLSVQSVVGGTSNTNGANWTEVGSLSTGSGVSGDIIWKTGGTGAAATVQNSAVTAFICKGVTQRCFGGATIGTAGYTVSTLPTTGFAAGDRAYVTDQLTTCAVNGAALTGGGSAVCPAFFNGASWVGG